MMLKSLLKRAGWNPTRNFHRNAWQSFGTFAGWRNWLGSAKHCTNQNSQRLNKIPQCWISRSSPMMMLWGITAAVAQRPRVRVEPGSAVDVASLDRACQNLALDTRQVPPPKRQVVSRMGNRTSFVYSHPCSAWWSTRMDPDLAMRLYRPGGRSTPQIVLEPTQVGRHGR